MIPTPTPGASGEPLSDAKLREMIDNSHYYPELQSAFRELLQRRAASLPPAQGEDVAAIRARLAAITGDRWVAQPPDPDDGDGVGGGLVSFPKRPAWHGSCLGWGEPGFGGSDPPLHRLGCCDRLVQRDSLALQSHDQRPDVPSHGGRGFRARRHGRQSTPFLMAGGVYD